MFGLKHNESHGTNLKLVFNVFRIQYFQFVFITSFRHCFRTNYLVSLTFQLRIHKPFLLVTAQITNNTSATLKQL